MNQHQNIKSRKFLSKGMLIVTVLLCLFSFAGFSVDQSQQKQITKTELVVSFNQVSAKTHSLKRTISSGVENNPSCKVSPYHFRVALLQFAQLVKVKFDMMSNKLLCFKSITGFYKLAYIPHWLNEDGSSSTRG